MRPITALIPFALMAGLSLPAFADEGVISVTGTGEISAAPDTAYINSGVTTQGATAREALDANSAAMEQLIATLKEAGIAERDIQTSNFSVNPNYVYSDARDADGYNQPPKINGYQVSNTVTVRIRDLDSLGAVLDQQVSVGANQINGISFAVDETTPLYDEARQMAFADARRKAGIYADVAGESLGDVVSITENQGYSAPQPMQMRATTMAYDESAKVPVAGGELNFAVNVQVTWDIED
ncbi:SIMPL domain-containing protein [Devosia sp.]|uniref:SIMPL domain-containing protein n=1 Tax=Devosia sp. TaxID=1871048 RepID=UPI003A950A53